MRHPTVLLFWALVAMTLLWATVSAEMPYSEPWSAGSRLSGSASLLAGPGAWGSMHGWGRGPYVLSPTGNPPQVGDVERALNEWLAREENPRLKLGPVTEKDSSTFQADIVTKEGSPVQRFEIDRRSGRIAPVED